MTTAVAIALYNGEKYLKRQLDCIRLQTKLPDQVVLCDDGSKDNTVKMVQEYIEEHSLQDCWFLHQNPQNLGYAKNFHHAISLCNAELVFLCDQDDIWELEKIEKMTSIMESRTDISLLACRYGIMDASENVVRSFMEPTGSQTGKIRSVSLKEIARAYRWPGMIMCIRKSFFSAARSKIESSSLPHDLLYAILAANENAFCVYDYIGAYHRRHDSNTAREEHRVSKLLQIDRKLFDLDEAISYWEALLDTRLDLNDDNRKIINTRLSLMKKRKSALTNRSLLGILSLYLGKASSYLRLKSFVCDIYLVLFAKN